MALGAQRKRLIRQMLTESVVLSCMGGLAGLVLAYAGTKVLLAMAFPDATNLADPCESVSWRAGVCVRTFAVDGVDLWHCAGMGDISLGAG